MDELFEDDGKFKNSIIRFSNSLSKSNVFVFGMPLFKKYSIMFDYNNKVIGLKGDNIYDFSNVYKKWMEQKSVVKITTKGAQKEDEGSLKEKLVLVGGICLGIFIILGVWFYNKRRNLDNKLHSELIEENKTLPDNNNLNELEIAKKL
jgi:hypothetical protein